MKGHRSKEAGQAMTDFALVLSLLAVVILGGLTLFNEPFRSAMDTWRQESLEEMFVESCDPGNPDC